MQSSVMREALSKVPKGETLMSPALFATEECMARVHFHRPFVLWLIWCDRVGDLPALPASSL